MIKEGLTIGLAFIVWLRDMEELDTMLARDNACCGDKRNERESQAMKKKTEEEE